MPRLIDADELSERMWRTQISTREDIDLVIRTMPTVDAVEVIRCKDCEYFLSDEPTICELTMCGANDEGFCAWAERKEDEQLER